MTDEALRHLTDKRYGAAGASDSVRITASHSVSGTQKGRHLFPTETGHEVGFVVGLISGVISIIEATKTIYDAAKDAKGQPEAFRQVHARLILVIGILDRARERAQIVDETTQEALEPILESCKAKAEKLNEIFQVIRKDDDKWYDRYKTTLGTLGEEYKVECLMEEILKDIQVLVCESLMGTATDAQMREIQEAIKEMNEMPSSLQDETVGVTQNQGSGLGWRSFQVGGSISETALQDVVRSMSSLRDRRPDNDNPHPQSNTATATDEVADNGKIAKFRDQYGPGFQSSPTPTRDEAKASVEMVERGSPTDRH
ncbi:hypothetical protein VE02_08363 [Pseudogymnoascus sp. 03VT05]|nr:hypothetical protein VE02_08363 [Pseudogymnoascus sp. 03VT05]